jgi:hypothetical protein
MLLWAALLVALVIFAVGRTGKGGALTLAYFLGLSLIHVPGVLPFLSSDPGLGDFEETQIGFELTILGMASFVFGSVLARATEQRHASTTNAPTRFRVRVFEHLGWRVLTFGIIGYFVLVPLSQGTQSLTSIVSATGTLLILGFWLFLYGAAMGADRRRTLATLALLPLLPLATLVLGGFLGYGINWILSIVAFLFVISQRRIWFYVGAPIGVLLGLSLFVNYMGQRAGIRELVWEERASLLDRLDRVSAIFTEFQLLDLASSSHSETLDVRLNQNSLVGAAVKYHDEGSAPFAYGTTIPIWMLIPRAIWPDKPEIGGGGDLVSEFTGIRFAEGTSVGTGQVLEFYVNFGIPGLLCGFVLLGFLLMRLDNGIMRALAVDDMRGLLLRAMPGLMLLQPGGNLMEIIVAGVAAYVVAHMLGSMKFFDVSSALRSHKRVA